MAPEHAVVEAQVLPAPEVLLTPQVLPTPPQPLPPAVATVAATGMFSAAELEAFAKAFTGNPGLCLDSISNDSISRQSQRQASTPQVYVNAKQYHRIMRRRAKRAQAAARNQQLLQRKPFLHESRHQHAQKRRRGPGGRFLTKGELAAAQLESDGACCQTAGDSMGLEDSAPAAVDSEEHAETAARRGQVGSYSAALADVPYLSAMPIRIIPESGLNTGSAADSEADK